MTAIEVSNLTKKFGNLTAVDKVSFTVEKGEIFAFLGPNGAGKSTTIKMLTTMLSPTSGEMKVGGHVVSENKSSVRERIGVIFQDYSLDDDLTAYENLYYHAMLYRVPKSERKEKIESLLKYVNLLDRKDDLVGKFSGGMKRRVEIARGLLHSPEILFLDEPTIGLDVQTRNFLWEHIRKINREKDMTIFFTTHNMEEAEKIATKIAVIDKGRIIITGTSKEIMKRTKTKSLESAFLRLTGYDIREENVSALERLRNVRRMRR
ncbi:MAG: ATP-binding cassette domain-containing protein [Candidatus Aenigmarchaeota archaeon]|nr:ATP-binding cassette domain-containing protein [Candidatus Aenigmarchaeota archaeon]